VTAGLAFVLSCAATGLPELESAVPVTPVVVSAPEEEPVTDSADGDDEPPESSPLSGPCWRHEESRTFEDCLRLVSPGGGWTVINNPRRPFGYVCAFPGHRGASCEGVLARMAFRQRQSPRGAHD